MAARLALTAVAAFLGAAGGHFAAAQVAPIHEKACAPDSPAAPAAAPAAHAALEHHHE